MPVLNDKLRQQIAALPLGGLAALYVKVRTKRDRLKREMEHESKKMEEIGLIGIKALQKEQGKSFNSGTFVCYTSDLRTASVKDKEAFRNWLKETGLWELLEDRASVTEVENYANTHKGAMPPGVEFNVKTRFNVHKA